MKEEKEENYTKTQKEIYNLISLNNQLKEEIRDFDNQISSFQNKFEDCASDLKASQNIIEKQEE